MAKVLSLSLRPRKLSDLAGQETTIKAIRKHAATRLPQAWLLHGGTGTGKTTLARILAVSYQCTHQEQWGNPCDVCWKERESFCIHEINASEVSGVEDLGKVAEMSRYRPVGSPKRVIVLDEMQRATNAAQNLLLKPFEEPPATTVWIVCTTEPTKILPTLRRRCVSYQLKPLSILAAEKFLKSAAKRVGITRSLEPLFEQLHLAQVGSPALLLMSLEKYAAGATATDSVAMTDGATTDTLRICKAVTSGQWATLRKLLQGASPEEARWIRASVSGWLRGIMARETNSRALDRAAVSLLDLTTTAPLEDAQLMLWLWGVLYKICKRYAG